jgi:GSH-dependent disulfide-bond oxidoreductase
MGDDYTIADISMLGWVRNLIGFYAARDLVAFDGLNRARERACGDRELPGRLERSPAGPARPVGARQIRSDGARDCRC